MKILYVGESIGQVDTAMFIHVENVAKLLKAKGHDVELLSLSDKENYNDKVIDGFAYHYTRYYKNRLVRKAINFLNVIYGYQMLVRVKKIRETFNYDMIIYYGYSAEARLISYCKKKNILFVIERVDWFERSDRKGFWEQYIYQYIVNNCYRNVDFKADAIIVISEYLKKYFSNHNIPVLLMPPIFSLKEFDNDEIDRGGHCDSNNIIRLIYCGNLSGDKDTVAPVIKAIENINDKCVYFTLDIVGVTQQDYERKTGDKINNSAVKFYGRMPHKKAVEVLKKSDITILLRQRKKYAKAGFSTKFAESMLCGIPVLCTSVGGADLCIRDMTNGFLLQSNSVNDVEDKLRKILSLKVEDMEKIKNETFDYAKKHFTIESKYEIIDEFFDEIIKR